jgi:hypothetical protein
VPTASRATASCQRTFAGCAKGSAPSWPAGGDCLWSAVFGCLPMSALCSAHSATTGCAQPGSCWNQRLRHGAGQSCWRKRSVVSRLRSGHDGHNWGSLLLARALSTWLCSRRSGRTSACRARPCSCTTLRASAAAVDIQSARVDQGCAQRRARGAAFARARGASEASQTSGGRPAREREHEREGIVQATREQEWFAYSFLRSDVGWDALGTLCGPSGCIHAHLRP